MQISKKLQDFDPIPAGYGISYRIPRTGFYCINRIPFNFIVGFIHRVCFSIRFFFKRGMKPTKAQTIYDQGYRAGLRAGLRPSDKDQP